MWTITLIICSMIIGEWVHKVAELKYGMASRQDELEAKMDKIIKRLENAETDKMETLISDVAALKMKAGFR